MAAEFAQVSSCCDVEQVDVLVVRSSNNIEIGYSERVNRTKKK